MIINKKLLETQLNTLMRLVHTPNAYNLHTNERENLEGLENFVSKLLHAANNIDPETEFHGVFVDVEKEVALLQKSSVLIVSYKLPAHYASALVNGDYSGLDDHEEMILNNWIAAKLELHGGLFYCLADNDQAGFCTRNDLTNEAGDCLIFNFEVNKEA